MGWTFGVLTHTTNQPNKLINKMYGKSLKGYERRPFFKEDICECLDVRKNQKLELGYLTHGTQPTGIVILFNKEMSRLEVKEQLDRIRAQLKDQIDVENSYNSI